MYGLCRVLIKLLGMNSQHLKKRLIEITLEYYYRNSFSLILIWIRFNVQLMHVEHKQCIYEYVWVFAVLVLSFIGF